MQVHHYMVDYEAKDGSIKFANDVELFDLAEAKKLAKRQSKVQPCTAAVVAFEEAAAVLGRATYLPVGHIMFFDGKQSDIDGVLA